MDDTTTSHQVYVMDWILTKPNGNLYFVYYDRRNYTDNRTDVYVAYSGDGGQTFFNKRVSETPFTPQEGIFFGDYNNIVAYDGIIRPVWTRLHGGELSLWTDLTTLGDILSIEEPKAPSNPIEMGQYPNPSLDVAYVSFKLHEAAKVSLNLYDMTGKLVANIMQDETKGYGKHIIPINLNELNLKAGTYLCKLSVNDGEKALRMIVVE